MWMTCLALAGKCEARGARGLPSARAVPSRPQSARRPARPITPRPGPVRASISRRVSIMGRTSGSLIDKEHLIRKEEHLGILLPGIQSGSHRQRATLLCALNEIECEPHFVRV